MLHAAAARTATMKGQYGGKARRRIVQGVDWPRGGSDRHNFRGPAHNGGQLAWLKQFDGRVPVSGAKVRAVGGWGGRRWGGSAGVGVGEWRLDMKG